MSEPSDLPILIKRDGPVLHLILNRPKSMNAVDAHVAATLRSAIQSVPEDPDIRIVALSAVSGRAFVAGADIKEMLPMGPAEAESLARNLRGLYRAMRECPCPVIAFIDGLCLGGGVELAIACDLRIATDRSQFGLPEVTLGILPGGGGTARLAGLIGTAVARRLCMTGEFIPAEEALRLNLIDELHPAEGFDSFIAARLDKFAAMSPVALSRIKQVFARIIEQTTDILDEIEIHSLAQCFAREDQKEGMTAFIEKRKPVFTGR